MFTNSTKKTDAQIGPSEPIQQDITRRGPSSLSYVATSATAPVRSFSIGDSSSIPPDPSDSPRSSCDIGEGPAPILSPIDTSTANKRDIGRQNTVILSPTSTVSGFPWGKESSSPVSEKGKARRSFTSDTTTTATETPEPDLKWTACTPEDSPRYYPHNKAPVLESRYIAPGPPSRKVVKRENSDGVWESFIHPEGLLYYSKTSPEIPGHIITESNAKDPIILEQLSRVANAIIEQARMKGFYSDKSVNVDLVLLDIKHPEFNFGYYFVDHEHHTIFWLEGLDSEDLGVGEVCDDDHLRLRLQQLYWDHVEYFPCQRPISVEIESQLTETLAFWLIDAHTSTTSTCPFDRRDLGNMLPVLKHVKGNTGAERNAVIARMWSFIYRGRFYNYHGLRTPRLYRTQIEEKRSKSYSMWFISIILFGAPNMHLKTIRELYVDHLIYQEGWRRLIELLLNDWQDLILWSTVVLTANMSFLAIFNSRDDIVAENPAITCSLVSAFASIFAIIIGLLFVRQKYLEKHSLQSLVIAYSLPYGLLMWAMLAFVAAIILYIFTAGVTLTSGIVVASIDLFFLCGLLWIIRLFWPNLLGGWISSFSFGGLWELIIRPWTQTNERVKTESSGVSEAVQIDMGMIRSRKSSLESYGKEAV
ncbi:hypothetical protein M422DRAFT_37700 [Sphaerobolus stellatus SS14]|uniref:Uncharacterized protein n=1 Tax=Sphaerobolus stellatus (strain SS14) TaxID=990650 RepID=A0A0C9U0P7_SPHS4|nr:hypothetical protein M422DRAFT_37700 [Sphaerobolus stellatus SS14]